MFAEYMKAAMHLAQYEFWEDEKQFLGRIPVCEGVLATGDTLEACRDELESVLEGWLLLSLQKNLPIPVINDISLSTKEAA